MEALLIIEMYMLEVLHTGNPCRETLFEWPIRGERRRRKKNLAQGEGLAKPWVLVVKKARSSERAKESVKQPISCWLRCFAET